MAVLCIQPCTESVPLPAAAWCCSCCSPGPAVGHTCAGSQPQSESHSAPCSAAPPHARPFLPESTHQKRKWHTGQLNTAALRAKQVSYSRWSFWCSSHSPSSSPSGSSVPLEIPRSETSVCWGLPSGCWCPASPGPNTQKRTLMLSIKGFDKHRRVKFLHRVRVSHVPVSGSSLLMWLSTRRCCHFWHSVNKTVLFF